MRNENHRSQSHDVLVVEAAKWLWRKNCVLVATEFTAKISETPDAIGWDSNGWSILIECKVTRSDFFADQNKIVRQMPDSGVGRERYYFTTKGVFEAQEIPEPWGLLEWDGKRVYTTKKATSLAIGSFAFDHELCFLISAIRRFDQQHLDGVSVKAYPYEHPTKAKATIGFIPAKLS